MFEDAEGAGHSDETEQPGEDEDACPDYAHAPYRLANSRRSPVAAVCLSHWLIKGYCSASDSESTAQAAHSESSSADRRPAGVTMATANRRRQQSRARYESRWRRIWPPPPTRGRTRPGSLSVGPPQEMDRLTVPNVAEVIHEPVRFDPRKPKLPGVTNQDADDDAVETRDLSICVDRLQGRKQILGRLASEAQVHRVGAEINVRCPLDSAIGSETDGDEIRQGRPRPGKRLAPQGRRDLRRPPHRRRTEARF